MGRCQHCQVLVLLRVIVIVELLDFLRGHQPVTVQESGSQQLCARSKWITSFRAKIAFPFGNARECAANIGSNQVHL